MWINCIRPIIANDTGNKYAAPTRKSYLDTLVLNKAIKPSSRDWLTGAMDPFHDFNFDPQGLPDQFAGATVVQFIKRKVTITPPPGLAADALWDCHVTTVPVMTTEIGYAAAYGPGVVIIPSDAVDRAMATVTVVKAAAGKETFPTTYPLIDPGAVFSTEGYSPCDNGNDFSMMRIIGGGFEIHNDTAALYKKGSVTVYSQPTELTSELASTSAPGSGTGFSTIYKSRMPPSTSSLAISNINARTWSAADGCYVPFLLNMDQTSFSQTSPSPLVLNFSDSSADNAYTVSTGAVCTGMKLAGENTPMFRASNPLRKAGLDTVGAYFTGLGIDTVLTLDVRFIVEVAPTPANTTLISLSSPSSEYDPEALILYSKAVRELPPGVKVSMNAAGDWWRLVSGAIGAAAPVIARLGPYGAAAATLATGAKAIGDTVLIQRQNKRVEEIERRNAKKGTQNPRAQQAPPKKPLNPNAKVFVSKLK